MGDGAEMVGFEFLLFAFLVAYTLCGDLLSSYKVRIES